MITPTYLQVKIQGQPTPPFSLPCTNLLKLIHSCYVQIEYARKIGFDLKVHFCCISCSMYVYSYISTLWRTNFFTVQSEKELQFKIAYELYMVHSPHEQSKNTVLSTHVLYISQLKVETHRYFTVNVQRYFAVHVQRYFAVHIQRYCTVCV